MAGAAEDVAEEAEVADLVGHEPNPLNLAGHDVRANLEVGGIEAHEHVRSGELKNHGYSKLQIQMIGRVGELARQNLDDLFLGLSGGTHGADSRQAHQ